MNDGESCDQTKSLPLGGLLPRACLNVDHFIDARNMLGGVLDFVAKLRGSSRKINVSFRPPPQKTHNRSVWRRWLQYGQGLPIDFRPQKHQFAGEAGIADIDLPASQAAAVTAEVEQMKKKSFREFVRRHSSSTAKSIKADLPDVKGWGEVRIHLRGKGMSDDELVKVRALWREYSDDV